MSSPQRPTLVDVAAPSPDVSGVQPIAHESTLLRDLAREALAEVRGQAAAPAPAGGGPVAPRIGSATLLVLALGGAFLVQRGEATRDLVATATAEQAKVIATMEARLATVEQDRSADRGREIKRDDALREALFVLAEDSRAVWDALEVLHGNTAPAGAAPLRKPTTSSRLTGLRDTVGRVE